MISIAAGVSLAKLTDFFEKPVKPIRAMPNTPALVSEAMSALSPNSLVTKTEQDIALTIFRSFGKAEFVPESLMDTVVGVSGSSPAYAYLFIEAMADAAVYDGMPRAQAYQFAAQAECSHRGAALLRIKIKRIGNRMTVSLLLPCVSENGIQGSPFHCSRESKRQT